MPIKRSHYLERIFGAILAPFRALLSLGKWFEWALDRALQIPFRSLSGLSIWLGWVFHRVLRVPFRKLLTIHGRLGGLWERSLQIPLRFLAGLSGWIVWALLQILLAPSHTFSSVNHWLQEVLDPDPQEEGEFQPIWQRAILFPFNVTKRFGDLIRRILSYPFRRWIDES